MKVLTWNIYSSNPHLQKVVDFLRHERPDVACLQEVSRELLAELRKLDGYKVVASRDFIWARKNGRRQWSTHLVTLCRKPVLAEGRLRLKRQRSRSTTFQRWLGWLECLQPHYVDVVHKTRTFRIFNVHLTNGGPFRTRLREAAFVLRHLCPQKPNLVCGDFNTYGRWYMNLLFGWLFGLSAAEMTVDEPSRFTSLLDTHGLKNTFENTSTHTTLGFTLDGILVPHHLDVANALVVPNTHGSDHYPLIIELADV